MNVKCIICGIELTVSHYAHSTKYCKECRIKQNRILCKQYSEKKTQLANKRCVDCGKLLRWRTGERANQLRCTLCNRKHARGKYSPQWKGGKMFDKDGYVLIYHPEPHLHKINKVYVPEHILVWESTHNQLLPKEMLIHHINNIRSDNRPENLAAMTHFQHKQLHSKHNHFAHNAMLRRKAIII